METTNNAKKLNKEKFIKFIKNRKVMAGVMAGVLVIVAAVIVLIAASINSKHPLEGSFFAGVGEDVGATSSYTFSGDSATNVYFDGEKNVTIEYEYEVVGKNTDKKIVLTRIDNGEEHTFDFSIVTDEKDNITAIIINTVWYYKQ